jgi:hypothetical protein
MLDRSPDDAVHLARPVLGAEVNHPLDGPRGSEKICWSEKVRGPRRRSREESQRIA